MAGGGGTRLWPKSRLKKPKQLQALISSDSMIKTTTKRVLSLIPENKIYISTNKEHVQEIKKELPTIKNIIIEPYIRNTGPAIGLAALILSKKTDEPVAFLPSDHYIPDAENFCETLKIADLVAKKNFLVTIGIRPTDPDTGLGYIKIKSKPEKIILENSKKKQTKERIFYRVDKFIEKPTLERAKQFVSSGQYFWNAGIFVAKPSLILGLFKKHSLEIYRQLQIIDKNPSSLEKVYQSMENISIDYAIAEKAEKIAVIPADFEWSDIGNWARLLDKLSRETDENVVVGCEHYGIETKGCLIHGTERLVATIGLEDIIVVDTPDAVLVCHKNKAHKVKEIVEKLSADKRKEYL